MYQLMRQSYKEYDTKTIVCSCTINHNSQSRLVQSTYDSNLLQTLNFEIRTIYNMKDLYSLKSQASPLIINYN